MKRPIIIYTNRPFIKQSLESYLRSFFVHYIKFIGIKKSLITLRSNTTFFSRPPVYYRQSVYVTGYYNFQNLMKKVS